MAHSESALADNIDAVATFTDAQILHEVMSTATRCRKQLALLLIYIGEMDSRRAHLIAGFPSAFEFCRKRLSLSEGETVRRLRVARAARRFPILLDNIASGELHLSGAALIAKHLEASNALEIIEAACGKSTHDIEVMIARLFPQEKKRDVIRPIAPAPPPDQQAPLLLVPTASPASPASTASTNRTPEGIAAATVSIANAELAPLFAEPIAPSSAAQQIAPLSPLSPASSTPSVTPVVEATYRLHVTLDQKTHEALREAQDLLRHSLPQGNFSDIVATALQQLVERLRKRKFARTNAARCKKKAVQQGAQTNKDVPTQLETGAQAASADVHMLNCKTADAVREVEASSAPVANASETLVAAPKMPPSPATVPVVARYIPAHIKRAVAERDGFACSFVAGDGTRCGSRSLLEYHHRIPFARGGMHTVDNVGLLCRGHNVFAAEQDFGQRHQARFRLRRSEGHLR